MGRRTPAHHRFVWIPVVASLLTLSAVADQSVISSRFRNPPVTFGALVSTIGTPHHEDARDAAFVIEGQNHFKQRSGALGFRQYGHGQSRLEIGTSTGISISASAGVVLSGLNNNEKFAPFLGIEPGSGRIEMNTNDRREDFYSWFPAMGTGLQFGFKSCRWLAPLIRGGAAIGNLGKSGILPKAGALWGAGTYLNCARFDSAIELLNLPGQERFFKTFDVAFPVGSIKIGVRAEQLGEMENRILLMIRSPVPL